MRVRDVTGIVKREAICIKITEPHPLPTLNVINIPERKEEEQEERNLNCELRSRDKIPHPPRHAKKNVNALNYKKPQCSRFIPKTKNRFPIYNLGTFPRQKPQLSEEFKNFTEFDIKK